MKSNIQDLKITGEYTVVPSTTGPSLLGYTNQDSIRYIPSIKSQKKFLQKFLPKVSRYFYALIILN